MRELNDQELLRHQSRAWLMENGYVPYQYEWPVTHQTADLPALFNAAQHQPQENGQPAGEFFKVSLAGRMMSQRIMGKAAFFNLHDSTGRIQVYVKRDDLPEGYYNEVFKKRFDLGDIVGVEGFVFITKTGELSVHAEKLQLLTKSLRPLPIVKETEEKSYGGLADKELRYRQRYADLAIHPEVREVFRKRAKVISSIRKFLDDHGFLEVETPALQPIYGGAAARPFTTHHNALDMQLFMRISDELYLKRLIVGGYDRVYEIAKNFRNEGLSRFHNPEFTALEFYVAYKDYNWMMDFIEEMIEYVCVQTTGASTIQVGENEISFARPWKRVTLFGAIQEATGYDLFGKSREALAEIAQALHLDIDKTMGAGKIIDEVFGTFVEPKMIQPTFIIDYPVELSPLAKRHRTHEGLVERFEVMCNGKEIINAFSELNDPIDQRERFEDQGRLSADGDDEAMQMDEDFLRALAYGMPPTAGLGLGIDRFVMMLTNQETIRDVILFPLLRAEVTHGETQETEDN